ncbi:MAG: twin-arginine translocation signal domain-containing protein, partial [Planctomycetota bacterium]
MPERQDVNAADRVSAAEPSGESRRHFLKAGAAAVAAGAVAPRANAATSSASLGDREIRVGLVGCGGRGTGAVAQLFEGQGPVKL